MTIAFLLIDFGKARLYTQEYFIFFALFDARKSLDSLVKVTVSYIDRMRIAQYAAGKTSALVVNIYF